VMHTATVRAGLVPILTGIPGDVRAQRPATKMCVPWEGTEDELPAQAAPQCARPCAAQVDLLARRQA
jgi:hypothetical protein